MLELVIIIEKDIEKLIFFFRKFYFSLFDCYTFKNLTTNADEIFNSVTLLSWQQR